MSVSKITMPNSQLSETFKIMLLLGGFFKLKKSLWFSIYSNFLHLYFIFQLICFCLGMASFRQEIDGFAFDLGAAISMSTTLMKVGIARSSRYQKLVKEIFEYDYFMNKIAKQPLKEEYSRLAEKQTPIFKTFAMSILVNVIASYFTALFFILRYKPNHDPMDFHKRPNLIMVWIPLDSEEHYIAANLFYSLMVTVVGGVSVTVDFMILYPMIYLIFRIQILKYVLQHADEFLDGRPETTRNEKYYGIIIECILEHEFIIRKHENFNRMITYFLFCDFLLRALQIAGFIFIIMSNVYSLNNFLYFGCVDFLLFQLFIQYWYGQVLVDESISLPTAIYMSEWYTVDVKTQKVMLLMMMRSQKPLGLKIGPMGMVQLSICIKILKTIYTIITIYSKI